MKIMIFEQRIIEMAFYLYNFFNPFDMMIKRKDKKSTFISLHYINNQGLLSIVKNYIR